MSDSKESPNPLKSKDSSNSIKVKSSNQDKETPTGQKSDISGKISVGASGPINISDLVVSKSYPRMAKSKVLGWSTESGRLARISPKIVVDSYQYLIVKDWITETSVEVNMKEMKRVREGLISYFGSSTVVYRSDKSLYVKSSFIDVLGYFGSEGFDARNIISHKNSILCLLIKHIRASSQSPVQRAESMPSPDPRLSGF